MTIPEEIARSAAALAKIVERLDTVSRPKCRCGGSIPPQVTAGRPRRSCSRECAKARQAKQKRDQRAAARAAKT